MGVFIDILSWACILGGVFFTLVGTLGLIRLPDFWARLHAVSVSDSGGMILLVLGMMLQAPSVLIVVKLALIGVFLFVTGPTATHAIANAALVTGWKPKLGAGLKADPKTPFADVPEPDEDRV